MKQHYVEWIIQRSVYLPLLQWTIYMLQSYAAVYCGNQNRSYHGTSEHLIQPDATITYPSMNISSSPQIIDYTTTDNSLLNDNTTELQSSSQRHRRSTSPGSSPHKLDKSGPKRMRTITKKISQNKHLIQQLIIMMIMK